MMRPEKQNQLPNVIESKRDNGSESHPSEPIPIEGEVPIRSKFLFHYPRETRKLFNRSRNSSGNKNIPATGDVEMDTPKPTLEQLPCIQGLCGIGLIA